MTDNTDLTHYEEPQAQPPAVFQSESGSIIAMLITAARDPALDADKMRTMKDLATELQVSERQARFNSDFNGALMDMPVITKAGIITIPAKDGKPERTQGRFARFEDIDRVVRPILRRWNLAIRFEVGELNQAVSVRPILSHSNGHTERGEAMRVPLDTSGAKNNTQGAGSAVTYGKRYTMCAFLNIVTEGTDDDGSLGKFEIGMPHEREVTVLEQAEEAHTAGTYPAYFASQSTKDRTWLITSGHHARLGGAPALPDASRSNPSGGGGQVAQRQPHNLDTAEGWTDQYVEDCENAVDRDALLQIQTAGASALKKLERGHAPLHARAVKAGVDALARLNGDEL
jgi:hypothetical protein